MDHVIINCFHSVLVLLSFFFFIVISFSLLLSGLRYIGLRLNQCVHSIDGFSFSFCLFLDISSFFFLSLYIFPVHNSVSFPFRLFLFHIQFCFVVFIFITLISHIRLRVHANSHMKQMTKNRWIKMNCFEADNKRQCACAFAVVYCVPLINI